MQSLLGFCYTFPWIIFIHFPIKFDHKQSCRNKTQEKCCNKYVIIVLFWFLSHLCLWYNDISGKHSLLCKLMSGQSKTRVALPDRQWAEQTGGTLWKHFPLLPELLSLDKLSSEYSIIRGVEIEYNCEKLMANERARIGGIWPMRRPTCGPITGWIWLRYSQLIFSTAWQLQAAALCGTSIFSSPDATIRVDRLLIPANQRPREASEQSQVANKKSVWVWTGNY